MKSIFTRNLLLPVGLLFMAGVINNIHAQAITKAATGTDLTLMASWTGGAVPGSANTATWASTSLGASLTMGSAESWLGIADNGALTAIGVTGAGALTLGTGGINIASTGQNLSWGTPITLGGAQTWTVGGGTTLTIGGVVSGATLGLTKTGAGTLDFNGGSFNTFGSTSGTLTISGGTLEEDFTTLGSTANLLEPTLALSMGGGTLFVNGGGAGTTSAQTFASTALTAGQNVINTVVNGTSTTLNLGAITVTKGATVQFSTTGTIKTSTPGTGGAAAPWGLLGVNGNVSNPAGYATYGTSDWATTDTASSGAGANPYTIIGMSGLTSGGGGYTAATGSTALDGNGNSKNYNVTGNITLSGNGGAYTVRFNTPGANSLNDNNKQPIVCAFLITPNMGATNVTVSGGSSWFANYTSTAAMSGVVWQNNTLGYFTFSCNMGNGRDAGLNAAMTYIQSGPGTVITTGNSPNATHLAYMGQTYLNGGSFVVPSDVGLGDSNTAAQVNLNGGTVVGTNTFTMDSGGGANKRPFVLGNVGGGLAAIGASIMTIDGIVSGAAGTGPLTIGIPASSANGNTQGLLPGSGSGTANTTPVMATGTVELSGVNTYTGGTILQSGTLKISGSSSLGTGGLTFTGGTLLWNGVTTDISAQTVTVLSGGATLDTDGGTITLANSIGNGGSGALTAANSGAAGSGALYLNGGSSYTGLTTVNSGATLGISSGNPTIAGAVTWNNGSYAKLTPGSTLTVSGAVNFNGTGSGNSIVINATAGSVTSTGSPFTLLTANGGISGTFNPVPAGGAIASGYVGTITKSANSLILTVTAVPTAAWTDASGVDNNWSTPGNWSASVGSPPPSGAQAVATFGTGASPVNLDVPETVGTVGFTSASIPYTISGGNTLTLDGSGSGAAIYMSSGAAAATISTAVALNDATTATVASGDTLTLSGVVASSAAKTLTIGGGGTVILSQANTYGGTVNNPGTAVGGATVQVGTSTSLGSGDVSVTDNTTLQAGANSLSVANNFTVASTKSLTVDNNGNSSLTLTTGVIGGSGGLTKINAGTTLTLGGANTYTGGTTINAGIVSISADGASPSTAGNLGNVPASATANNVILNGGDLSASANLALHANRGIGIGATSGSTAATGLIDAAGGSTTLTVNGVIASAGTTGAANLTVNSIAGTPGTVVLHGANTFNGAVAVNGGTLTLGNALALQNATLNYNNQGGTFSFGTLTAATFGGLSGSENLTLANTTPAAVALTDGGNNATTSYTGILGGSGSLDKEGTGATTIGSGANGGASYTGATTVNNGTMTLGGVGVMSAGNNLIQITGLNGNSTLNVADTAAITTTGQILVANGGNVNGTPSALVAVVVENSASVSGGSLVFGNGTRPGDGSSVTVQDSAALTVSGTFDLYNGASSGNSTENLNLNGGTTTVGSFLATSGSASHQSRINFNGGTLKANGNSAVFLPALSGLTADVNAGGAIINPNGYTITITQPLVHGTGTPDGGLSLSGTGILNLTGNNTYTGTTTVGDGTHAVTLNANNATGSTGTGTVTVSSVGTLSGTGNVGGAVTVNSGGILAAGSGGIGTLHFGTTLTLNAASTNTFAVTTAGGASNNVAVAGVLTPNSSVIKVTSGTALYPGTNTLFSYSNTVSGTFNPTVVFDVAPVHPAAIVDDGSHIRLAVPNAAPVAVSSLTSLGVTLGVPTTVQIFGGKYSFTDADNDALMVTNVSSAANGTVTFTATSITYTATNTADGATNDSFTYTVSDPYGGTNIQTVNVTINVKGQSQNVVSMTAPDGFGNVFFKYAGIPGDNYALEGITNTSLTAPYVWIPLVTNTAAGNGSLFFTNNTSDGYHFFRTHYVP